MAATAGRNNGVTGIIDFGSNPLPPIQCDVQGFTNALLADVIPITGPGSNFAHFYYTSNVGGSMEAHGNVASGQRPFPPTLHNLQGTLTHQADAGCTISFPVLVKSLTCERAKATADHWTVEIELVKNGPETVTWKGQATTYSQPALTTTEMFDGTQKVSDPQALTTEYLVKYFLPLGGSSDAAGNAAVDNLIATASPPRTGLKAANATLLRLDDAAGLCIVRWALKDSADEWILAHTKNIMDPKSLRDEASAAQVFVTSSPPSDPTPPTALDGTTLKLVDKRDETLTPGGNGKTGRTWDYGRRDSEDDWELSHARVSADPRNLRDQQVIAQVFTTSSPPSDPTPPVGLDGVSLKLVTRSDEVLTPGATGRTGRAWEYGRNDTADQLERSLRHGTWYTIDPNGLDSGGRVTKVGLTASPPSVPTSPDATMTYGSTTTHPVTDDYSMFIFNFEPLDSKARLELTRTLTDSAPVDLESTAEIPKVDATPSAPSGKKLLILETKQLPNGHVLNTGKFGYRDSNDVLIYDNTEVSIGITPSDGKDVLVEIVPCLATDTLESLLAAKVTAVTTGQPSSPVQGFPLKQVRARRYHKLAVIFTTIWAAPTGYGRVDPGNKIKIRAQLGPVTISSWLTDDAGTPALNVVSCITRGTGKYLVQLGRSEILGIGGPITIHQKYTSTSPPVTGLPYLKTNSVAWTLANVTYPKNSVMFLNCNYEVSSGTFAGTYDYELDYMFNVFWSTDFKGFPKISGIPGNGLIHATSSIGTGVQDGTAAGSTYTWSQLPSVKCVIPDTDSFSFASGWTQ